MKILITNDDGIHAPGFAALENAARDFGEVVVVAPNRCFSSCGHTVTTDRPLELTELAPNRYMLDGSPADCIRVAMCQVAADVDWVIAGVNSGGNLGVDVYMSGTLSAAREAALFGKKAIAISQYRKTRAFEAWPKSAKMAKVVISELISLNLSSGAFWNVNLPDESGDEIPERVSCPVDTNPLPVEFALRDGKLHYMSHYQTRPRTPECDVDECFGGKITVSLLRNVF